jgi:hypothetical protein
LSSENICNIWFQNMVTPRASINQLNDNSRFYTAPCAVRRQRNRALSSIQTRWADLRRYRACSGAPGSCEGRWDSTNRRIKTASYLKTNVQRLADGVGDSRISMGRWGTTGTRTSAARRRQIETSAAADGEVQHGGRCRARWLRLTIWRDLEPLFSFRRWFRAGRVGQDSGGSKSMAWDREPEDIGSGSV